jgi:hypothetical protein
VHPRFSAKPKAGGKPEKASLLLAFLVGVGIAASSYRPALAESRSALVMVSVRVVESCRVETSGALDGQSMDLSMRCNSKVRPSLGLSATTQTVAPTGKVSVPHSQIGTTANGKTLNIEF